MASQLMITTLKGYHHGDVRDSSKVYVVIHSDESGSPKGSLTYLKRTNKSYHYFIDRSGKIYQMVDPKYKANHAGWSIFHGLKNWNDFSIGICFSNDKKQEFTEAQYRSGKALLDRLKTRYPNLTNAHVVRHQDIAFFRGKVDPGPKFEMMRLFMEIAEYK